MRYDKLHINNFGKLHNITMSFSEGINVIYGPNESGKSTLHAFLEAIQFGMERGRGRAAASDLYSRYYPESGTGNYGGVLEFTENDTTYSIYRNFSRNPLGYTLMDMTTGRALNLSEEEYRELLNNMTRSLYRNTVSLRQLQAATSKDFPEQLRSHIINLRTSGSAALDLRKTYDRLKRDRQALEQSYSADADRRASELRDSIAELYEEREKYPDASELPQWEKEKKALEDDISSLREKSESITERIHTHETYLEEHTRNSQYSLQEAEDRCQRLLDRRDRLRKQYPEPPEGTFRQLLPALTAVTLGGGALCVLAALFLIFGGNAAHALTALLPGAALLLAGRHFFGQWKVLNAYRYVDHALKQLYEEVLPQIPQELNRQSMDDFLALMEDLKSRKSELRRLRRQSEQTTGQLFRLQEELQRLQDRLTARKQEFWKKTQLDEQISTMEEELDDLQPRLDNNHKIREELDAVDLAARTIRELSVTAFSSFGTYLQDTSSHLMSQITRGRYNRLIIDDNLNILLEQDHVPVELKNLSVSTLDQVYLSLRIACIDFFWPNSTIPILLDESFAMYDSDRIAETLAWLAEYYPGQVFLFTCQHREEEIMTQAGISYTTLQL